MLRNQHERNIIMDVLPYSFCHYCGHTLEPEHCLTPEGYCCTHCNNITWLNAASVAVLIVPCGIHLSGRKHGVFTVRRGIPPYQGSLALPGGFIMHTPKIQETWQQAACRETGEEIQVFCRYDVLLERPQHVLTESSYSEKRVGDRVLVIGASGAGLPHRNF
jgi:NADH pyrophosphatase NudC (nudix superfamily)